MVYDYIKYHYVALCNIEYSHKRHIKYHKTSES